MAIDTVIFDFDGTLGDTNDLILNSWRAAMDFAGTPKTDDEILQHFGEPLTDTMDLWFGERADEIVDFFRNWQKDKYFDALKPFPGMIELIFVLKEKGYHVGVASSRVWDTLVESLRIFGLDEDVETLVSFEDTEEHKPYPAPLLCAMERMGAAAERTIYVGDSVVDILCGKAAGAKTCLVAWSMASDSQDLSGEACPDFIIEKPEDLLRILAEEV